MSPPSSKPWPRRQSDEHRDHHLTYSSALMPLRSRSRPASSQAAACQPMTPHRWRPARGSSYRGCVGVGGVTPVRHGSALTR